MSAISERTLDAIYREECSLYGCLDEYDALIRKGNTPQFASMIAMRAPPGTGGSEQAFWSGKDDKRRSHGLADMPRDMAEAMLAKAKRAGIDVQGKWYMGGLADHRGPGDPDAWINDISDIKRVARKRNLTVEGIVNIQGERMPPPPDKPLSERLIRESIGEMVAENPALATKPIQELREAAIDKHGAPARHRKKRKRGPGKSFVDLDTAI